MSSLDVCQLTKTDLEEQFELVKLHIIRSLVQEEIINFEDADEWCKTHAVVLTKKTIFKTISNLWSKKESADGYFFSVVSLDKK